MTPQEKSEFEEMKIFIASLKSSSMIPRNVQDSFAQRLGTLKIVKGAGTGSAGPTTGVIAFPFNLPANPSGTLIVEFEGVTYELLYK